MFSLTFAGCRIRTVVICCLSLLFAQSVAAQSAPNAVPGAVSAADLAKIQDSLNQMREFYEKRIDALESKVDKLQKQNSQLSRQVQTNSATTSAASSSETVSQSLSTEASPKPVASNPTLARGIVLPKIGVVTPEISLILDGKYSSQSQNPELPMRGFLPSGAGNIPRGFSLGESELALAGTVDNLFRAEARFVMSQDENGTSFAVEEAFFETLGLPEGFKLLN